MKKIYLFLLCFITLFILISSYVFLYVPIYKIGSNKKVTIEVNSKFNDSGIKMYYRGKKVKNIDSQNNIDVSKIGKYNITYNVIINGKVKRKIKKVVNVVDTQKPVINLRGESQVIINYNEKYVESGYESADNYDGNITDKVSIFNEVNSKKLGTYNVNYSVSDSSHNVGRATRKVIVKDLTSPEIKVNRNKDSYVVIGNDIDLSYSSIDNYDGNITDKTEVIDKVDINKVGKYTITYKVSDSSNNTTNYLTTINVQNKNIKGVPVLMYHWFYDDSNGETYGRVNNHNYISKSNFELQLKYLVDNDFYFATWKELEEYIDDKIDLPDKSIIITDDDGNESFFRIAIPLCQKYKVPVTSFVITDRNEWKEYKGQDYLDFESHSNSLHSRTCNGPRNGAAMCSSYENLYNDTKTSVEMVESKYAFAYPFGHYNDEYITAIKKSGIHMAFTTENDRVKKGSNKYKLPRVRISRSMSIDDYAKKVN